MNLGIADVAARFFIITSPQRSFPLPPLRSLCLCIVLAMSAAICNAQKSEDRGVIVLNPAEGAKDGQTLVTKMLLQKPAEDSVQHGQLKVFEGKGKWRDVPLWINVRNSPTNMVTDYTTTGSDGKPDLRLSIGHAGTNANTYLLQHDSEKAKAIPSEATFVPFAGSDFWVADLGLEFLHWPKQRVLRKEMRRSQFCAVLESTNPDPKNGYLRVLCWIDTDPPYGIVHAEAYDFKNELLKNFDPTEIKKIEGRYELEEMEIRNRKTGSRTKIQFNLQ